jgi:sulfoxide reductase heme-binding subunit YedZ
MPLLDKLLRSKLFVWIVLVVPGLWPLWPVYVAKSASVLADPFKYVLHHLGFVACVLLAAVLTFTPLRVLWPKWGLAQALNRHRRLVGVSAFVYGALHFTTHLVYESGLDASFLPEVFRNSVKKPFQLVGMITLAILLVLAVTSLNIFLRWLGGKAWKNLHRLAYLAAALAAYHQAIARKVFPLQVVWIFGPLALLEIARVWKQFAASRASATASRAAQTG